MTFEKIAAVEILLLLANQNVDHSAAYHKGIQHSQSGTHLVRQGQIPHSRFSRSLT